MMAVEAAIQNATKFRNHNVLITETFELARQQASDALRRGIKPFPVVIKDCFLVDNSATTCSSRMLDSFKSPYSSTIVSRIVDHGGCVIGKANMDEFSMGTSSVLGYFGPVKSGLTLDVEKDWYVAGGSSGGPAVAVQLGMADIAIGSDTGGSTRNPAAFNGLFGLKPTYGVLSRFGLIPLVNSLDVPAIISKSAKDCKRYLKVMAGRDDNDSTSLSLSDQKKKVTSLEGLRVGIPKEFFNKHLSSDALNVWNDAATAFNDSRATLVPISLSWTPYSLDCYHVLSTADIASNMARYDGVAYGYRSSEETSTLDLYASSRSSSFNETVRKRIMAGNYFLMKRHQGKYVDRAKRIRRKISEEIRSCFQDVDVLLTPVASGSAPLHSEQVRDDFSREDCDDYYTQSANLAGLPAISIPFGLSSKGLPLGVQLIGNLLSDYDLCDIAHKLSEYKKKL